MGRVVGCDVDKLVMGGARAERAHSVSAFGFSRKALTGWLFVGPVLCTCTVTNAVISLGKKKIIGLDG